MDKLVHILESFTIMVTETVANDTTVVPSSLLETFPLYEEYILSFLTLPCPILLPWTVQVYTHCADQTVMQHFQSNDLSANQS